MNPAKLDTLEEHPSEEGLEVHPLIPLLVARMESHPKEFYRYSPMGAGGSVRNTAPNQHPMNQFSTQMIEHTKSLWNRKEKRLYNMALRRVRMEEAHDRLMHALLNGLK